MQNPSGRADFPPILIEQARLYPDAFRLMPLHRPGDVEVNKKGKRVLKGKAPFHKNWTKRTYVSRETLAQAERDQRNIGVQLQADQLVIDVDPRNGGEHGLKQLCQDYKLDFSTFPTVVTGSGGLHIYCSKPSDQPVIDTLKGYPGVEFKSVGRQVVAAGSIHPETNTHYCFREDRPPLTNTPPAIPDSLLRSIKRAQRDYGTTGGGQYEPHELAHVLEGLDPKGFREESEWRQLAMACHHATNGDGRAEFIAWSTSDPEYEDDADRIGRRWDSFNSDRENAYTYRTLNSILRKKRAGDRIPRAHASREAANDFADFGDTECSEGMTFDGESDEPELVQRGLVVRNHVAPDSYHNALCAVHNSGLEPRWNELKQVAWFAAENLPWPEEYGRGLNDQTLRLIRLFLAKKHQGVAYQPSKDHLFEALMTVAYGNKHDPVAEYLDGLRWDGVPRVERLFADYFRCGDDAYTGAVATCFMVGAVRRVRQPGCKFDTMPILIGAQGVGKSTGLATLFGREWHSDANLGDLHSKDAAMILSGVWCQEFAELEGMNRAAATVLKAFMSTATDRYRGPYDRVVTDAPRRCVFAGTTNERGALKDSTGARRFWPLDVAGEVDVAGLARDRDQLWAEAAALEAAGTPVTLPRELWGVAAERQAAETTEDPWADRLRTFLEARPLKVEDGAEEWALPADRVHTSELFDALQIRPAEQSKDKSQRLRTVMENQLGWQHERSVRVLERVAKGYVRAA